MGHESFDPKTGHVNPWVLANDQKGQVYYPKDLFDAWEKLSEWENQGYDIQRVSIGLMQLVPRFGLKSFNLRYGKSYGITEILERPALNIEAGTGHLRELYDDLGDWEKASMAYNVGPDLEPRKTAEEYLGFVRKWMETAKKILAKGT